MNVKYAKESLIWGFDLDASALPVRQNSKEQTANQDTNKVYGLR